MYERFGSYLVRYFKAKVEKQGTEYRFNCPNCHDKKGHFSFNIIHGVSNCWKCSYSPSPRTFLLEHGTGLSHEDIIELTQPAGYKTPVADVVKPEVILPEGVNALEPMTGALAELYKIWLAESGVSHDGVIQLGLRLVVDKQSKQFGRVIIPVYENRTLVYWMARGLTDVVKPRYLFPKIPRTDIVYNINLVDIQTDMVLVTEGWKDAYKVDGVGLLGKTVSITQINKVMQRIKCKKLGVMLDKDAWQAGWKVASRFYVFCRDKGIDVYLYLLTDAKDPGDCIDRDDAICKSKVYNFSLLPERVQAKFFVDKSIRRY